MVTINYQSFGSKGFQLRLRFYQDGETKYINVTKKLIGNIQKKHWNAKKQYFIPSCPFADENNKTIMDFRKPYDEAARSWSGTIYGLMASVKPKKHVSGDLTTLNGLVQHIIDEQKLKTHEDGTPKGTYENYIKLQKRLGEYCKYLGVKYEKLNITDVTEEFVNGLFDWIYKKKGGAGAVYVSKTLHAVLMKGDKKKVFNFNAVKYCNWKKQNRVSVEKNYTLSEKQCKKLINMPLSQLPKNPKSELYRDFCVFLLCTGQSPCDAISLQKSNIKTVDGVEHIVFKRRKIAHKQITPCSLPITDTMRRIINKWESVASDGYIFPIRNNKKLSTQTTDNGDIKHFNGRLNVWLKQLGQILECDFQLHTYTFRHTAITHYLSKGVPIAYVANIMGTSIENCEQIYYNSVGDSRSRNLILNSSF